MNIRVKFAARSLQRLTAGMLFLAAGAALASEWTQPLTDTDIGKQAPSSFKFPRIEDRSTEMRAMHARYGVEYRIFISKPGGERPPNGYPVIYVLDGNSWFGVTAELARVNEPEIGKVLVVGVGYVTDGLSDVQRFLDMTLPGPIAAPPLPDLPELRYGGANRFLDFIENDLKPVIRREYGTDPARQVLFGHSLGGLFALHVLFTRPDAFGAYIASSPSIHWNDGAILAEEKQFLARKVAPAEMRLLITAGEFEQKIDPANEARMRRLYAANPQYLRGRTVEQAIEESRQGARKSRMVDNARELADRVGALGGEVKFFEFDGENHLSVGPAAISRTLPIALRRSP